MNPPAFTTAEGLRLLLLDLAYAGPRAWQTSPEAAELMTYTMEKYAGLAHKYGVEPTDAAAAAFEVMRMRSTRVAEDPWAVVTHAVELTLIYESRAEGMLCSSGQARKTTGLEYHDAERFADRESEADRGLSPGVPLLRHDGRPVRDPPDEPEVEPTNAFFALDTVVELFVDLGWPPDSAARDGVHRRSAQSLRQARDRLQVAAPRRRRPGLPRHRAGRVDRRAPRRTR